VITTSYSLRAEDTDLADNKATPTVTDNQIQFHVYMDQDDDCFYELKMFNNVDNVDKKFRKNLFNSTRVVAGATLPEGPFVEFNQTYLPYKLRIEDNAKFKNEYEEFVQEQFKKKLRFIFSNEFPLTIRCLDIQSLEGKLPDRNTVLDMDQWWESDANSYHGVIFDGVDFRHVKFVDGKFVNSSFRCAKLADLDTRGIEYINCDFTDAVIHNDTNDDILKSKSSGICSVKNIRSTRSYKEKNLTGVCIRHWRTESWNYSTEKFQLINQKLRVGGVYVLKSEFIPETIEKIINNTILNDEDVTLDLTEFNLTNLRIFDRVDKCTFTDAQIHGAQLGPIDINKYIQHSQKNAKIKSNWLPLGMSKDQLYSTHDYKIGSVNNITFRYSEFGDADFRLINFTDCRFINSNIKNTNFTDAIISRCDFSSAINLTVDQIKSTWNYKNNRMTGIKLPKKIQQKLDEEKQTAKK
jgi:uncharacterized protein YjbI with pentapeptide repeats